MDYTEFPAYFAQHIHADSSVALLLVRPSIDPAPDSFLRELVVVTWRRTGSGHAATFDLTEEEHVWRDRFFLGLSRRFDWAKSLRWKLQKKIELGSGETRIVSRNNAMRPPIAPISTRATRSTASASMTRESSSPVSSTRGMGTPSPADTVSPRRRLRRYVLGALAVALVLVAGYSFGYEPPYRGTLVERPPRPLIFAHRGFGDHGPDNSLYAVEHALRAGMDGVDVDGQLTRDGEVVIFHDLSVDRLTSGVGRVRDKTRDEMLTLDLGPNYDPTIRGAYVRTFEDFVRTVRGHGILMVELKVPGLAATGIERRAVDIIRRYDAYRDVVLSSFNPLVLYRVKRPDPRVRTAFIFMDTNWNPKLLAEIKPGDQVDLPWMVRQEFVRRALRKVIRPDLLSINQEVDHAVIDRLIAKGWPVFIWTPDEDQELRWALAQRPYGVISDRPIRAKELRDQ